MIKAADIMTTEIITVTGDVSIQELAKILLRNKISGAPVVDNNGKLQGIVCESDLIEQQKKLHLPTVITILDAVIFLESTKGMEREMKKMAGSNVKDVMSSPVITVNKDTPLSEIASIMTEKRKYLIPVMSGDDLIGIIGKADLVKAIAGED